MRADYHVHTYYSDDSTYPMEDVVLKAIELGLNEICFTDHVDYGVKIDPEYLDETTQKEYRELAFRKPENDSKEAFKKWLDERRLKILNVNYPKYVKEIQELQKKYKDKIRIKMGLEFGIQRHTIDDFEKLFARYPFDFILLSIHQVNNKEFWTNEFQEGKSEDEFVREYYEELLYVVEHYKNYSVLAHLDLITRYDPYGPYPFAKAKKWIEPILKQVIKDGKGIEVNTSSFYYNLQDLTPSRDILKLYKELGGEIITIGSDSHKEIQLGSHIEDYVEELKKIGFTKIATFDHMKPTFHTI